MTDGDKKLIDGAVRGESSAFGQLYDMYQPKIFRFIYLKVSHREEAEDLTHQVFLKAWQNMKGYSFRGLPFSSWLYQIARNAIIDHYRTKKNHTSIDETELHSFETEMADELDLQSILDLEKIKGAMNKLTSDQQDVLIMRFVDDLPNKEIAAAMKKSEGAIKLIQHRAIKSLKEKIEKDGGNY